MQPHAEQAPGHVQQVGHVDSLAFTYTPPVPPVGDTVEIMLGEGARAVFGLSPAAFLAAADRFHGAVSDAKATLDGKGRAVYSLAAVSHRARLGRTFIGALRYIVWVTKGDGVGSLPAMR